MIGLRYIGAAIAAALLRARSAPLVRWTNLLNSATRTCKEGMNAPAYSAWDMGAPVQPVEFTRQLGNLQGALARAQQQVAETNVVRN